jgi:hypothetical protein
MSAEPAAIRYKAFISYSHKDEKAAHRLHTALERYRVPKPLVGKPGPVGPIERRLFPIFRDRDEFGSSADLTTAVRVALERSDFQIVVCSPAAAASRWVNEEILAFKRMGRADRVIALIVAGEPNAEVAGVDPALECFPSALRFKLDAGGALTDGRVEPLAADLRPKKDGHRGSLLKIISGLLGVRLDALRRRDAAQRRRRLVASLAAFFLAVVLPVAGVVGGGAYLYSLTYAEYGNAIAFDGTVPKIIGDVGGRAGGARADVIFGNRIGRWGQLDNIAAATAGGRSGACALQPLPAMFPPFAIFPVWLGPTPYALGLRAGSQPCVVRFTYDRADFGPVTVGLDVQNQFLQQVASVDLAQQGGSISVQASARGLPAQGQYGLEFQRNQRGRIGTVRFTYQSGAPARVSGDATRIDYGYDEASGLVTSVTFFNEVGRPAASGLMGRAGFRFAYDGMGRLTVIEGFDPDGVSRWSKNRDDPPKRTFTYDQAGNRQSIIFVGQNGSREADGHGVAEVRFENANGLVTGLSYLDLQGSLLKSKAIPCAREVHAYDDQSHPTEIYCFDADQTPASDDRGVHGQRSLHDAKGRLVEWDYLDANRNLAPARTTGVARTDYTYNDAGQITVIANYGADRQPTLYMGTEYARLESEWDDHGRLVDEKRFGVDNQLRSDPSVGYAELQLGYDPTGAENKRCFLDAAGHLMISAKDGFACMRTTKSYDGGVVTQTTWTENADGKPFVVPRLGSAKIERILTQDGRLVELHYLDGADRLMEIGDEQVAGRKNAFDERGRFIGVDFFGADGKSSVDRLCGYASLIISYTDDNWISVMLFQDELGKPVNAFQSGVATIRLVTKDPPRYTAADMADQAARSAAAGGLLGDLESGRINNTIERYLLSQPSCPF